MPSEIMEEVREHALCFPSPEALEPDEQELLSAIKEGPLPLATDRRIDIQNAFNRSGLSVRTPLEAVEVPLMRAYAWLASAAMGPRAGVDLGSTLKCYSHELNAYWLEQAVKEYEAQPSEDLFGKCECLHKVAVESGGGQTDWLRVGLIMAKARNARELAKKGIRSA